MDQRLERKGGFWRTVPGILTALGTFIGAVVGVGTFLASNHLWPFPPPPPGNVMVDPATPTFADVQIGQASAPQTVTVKNGRRDPLTVAVAVRGDATGSFAVAAETCSTAQLMPSATCQLEVIFSPTKTGPQNARVEVTTPDGTVAAQALLSGRGQPPGQLSFAPTTVYLGLFTGGNTPSSTSTNVKIANTGNGQVKIINVNADDSHFTVSPGCAGKTLQPSDSCSVTVTFSSFTNVNLKSKLIVSDTAPGGTHDIAVTGYRGPPIIILPPIPIQVIPSLKP
jgi:hypothetical protein